MLTIKTTSFVLVEEVYSLSNQAVSLFYDCLKLCNCRELFHINNVNSDFRYRDNKVGDLPVKFVLYF